MAEDTATLESGCEHSGALGPVPCSTAQGMTSGKQLSKSLQASSPLQLKKAWEERERKRGRKRGEGWGEGERESRTQELLPIL